MHTWIACKKTGSKRTGEWPKLTKLSSGNVKVSPTHNADGSDIIHKLLQLIDTYCGIGAEIRDLLLELARWMDETGQCQQDEIKSRWNQIRSQGWLVLWGVLCWPVRDWSCWRRTVRVHVNEILLLCDRICLLLPLMNQWHVTLHGYPSVIIVIIVITMLSVMCLRLAIVPCMLW